MRTLRYIGSALLFLIGIITVMVEASSYSKKTTIYTTKKPFFGTAAKGMGLLASDIVYIGAKATQYSWKHLVAPSLNTNAGQMLWGSIAATAAIQVGTNLGATFAHDMNGFFPSVCANNPRIFTSTLAGIGLWSLGTMAYKRYFDHKQTIDGIKKIKKKKIQELLSYIPHDLNVNKDTLYDVDNIITTFLGYRVPKVMENKATLLIPTFIKNMSLFKDLKNKCISEEYADTFSINGFSKQDLKRAALISAGLLGGFYILRKYARLGETQDDKVNALLAHYQGKVIPSLSLKMKDYIWAGIGGIGLNSLYKKVYYPYRYIAARRLVQLKGATTVSTS